MRLKNIIFVLLLFATFSGGEPAKFEYRPGRLPKAKGLYKADTLSICMIGDIMMHTKQIETAHVSDSTYDFSSYFSLIKDDLEKADISMANMEFTLGGKPYTGYPSFSAPDCFINYLESCGIDVLLCANNHIFDKGSKGARRTLRKISELAPHMRISGLAKDSTHLAQTTPLTIRRKGMCISLVNFTYGTNLGTDTHWPKVNYMGEKELLAEALKRSSSADLSIALPHWGTEYSLTPSHEQRSMASWLAENGADIIIGTHPHVPQSYETITEKKIPVAYSLGNAISNMSAQNTQLELMISVRLVRHPDGDTELLAPEFKYLWCSRPGGFGESYTVVPIEEYLEKKDSWQGAWDYDKMIATYNRVKNIINI